MTTAAPAPIELHDQQAAAAVSVRSSGPLTTATAMGLRERLRRHAATRARVVVDLQGVTAIDASGIATLLAAQRAIGTSGGALTLRPNDIVIRALRASRTIRAFDVWTG